MRKVAVVGILVAALVMGGLAHALVPHQHGHSHDVGESSIWTSLHSSLRHEDKKALYSLVEIAIFPIVAFVSTTLLGWIVARTRMRTPMASVAILRTPLRRGIVRYRAFA